jgi:hypothetical protein
LLKRLQHQVQVKRGRAGRYEVTDFVLLLLAYAVSEELTLADFFTALKPVEAVLMSAWERQKCPVASTLSRFLSDVDEIALERLRSLFEADLLEHGFTGEAKGGLLDRTGKRYWLFDVDGTKQTARQRSLPRTQEYPPVRRRSEKACAKGYMGRGRGEVVRTRSAIAQSHTGEWLGTFGAPGNGTPGPDLKRACKLIHRYLHHHGLKGENVIVRLDGYYGTPTFINELQQYQLGYILRGRDYQLLKYPSVQERLAQTVPQIWSHPEIHQQQEVFDLGWLEDTWAGYPQAVRLIVVRKELDEKSQPRVGKTIEGYVYELFMSSHLPVGLNGADLVSLYYGRGGFEKMLGDEDTEGDPDRWCSWSPIGQEFWQILCQWSWNWRLWAGWQQGSSEVRQTLWRTALDEISSSPSGIAVLLPPTTPLASPYRENGSEASEYGPMQVAPGWAKSLRKFSGEDFQILNERQLRCPAGHNMYRRETRHNRLGDLVYIFSINPRTCRTCPLKEQCLADGSAISSGRQVSVICKKLPLPEPRTQTSTENCPVPSPKPPDAQAPGECAVFWLDLPACQLRRTFKRQLRQHQLQIEFFSHAEVDPVPTASFFTRARRAHRRLNWAERFTLNALPPIAEGWRVKLFGISESLSQWLQSLRPLELLTS